MEEELVYQFQLVLQTEKEMDYYVIQFAKKDFKVSDQYAGRFVLQDL